MATLTKANYEDKIDIVLSKVCKVSPDEEAKKRGESKVINLEVNYTGLTFKDLMAKALKSDVIAYQSGARKNYDKLTNNQVVKINAASPGASYVDPETAFIDKIATMSPEDALAKLRELEALIKKGKK